MSSSLLETLLLSSKIEPSEDYDATYETLPVVIAESTKDLDAAFAKLDEAGGHKPLMVSEAFTAQLHDFV